MLHYTWLGKACQGHSSLLAPFIGHCVLCVVCVDSFMNKIKFKLKSRAVFTTPSQLMDDPNKLACYTTLALEMLGRGTLAYWPHS